MAEQKIIDVTEQKRLNDAREAGIPWKKWGPYLSERQWGTVREDYSEDGNAWDYFTHDQSRSRAYRWGEDGLGGISDDKQRLCFALALWNEQDPILKERLYGLTNSEANHGEDVKEYYFYIDSTPTHSYMKYLYKYPQREYPYRDLIETNRRRSREEFEYELLDTGVFDDDRYFDVFVEYAKEGPEDVLIRITVHNRGLEAARLRLLVPVRRRLSLTRGRIGIRLRGSSAAPSSFQTRLILRFEVDRRLGDRLFLTHQAVLTSCDVAEIPLTLRCPDRLANPVATVSINSRQILMTPQTHARTAF